MTTLFEDTLTGLLDLDIHAAQAEAVTWQGREPLRLENDLALRVGAGTRGPRGRAALVAGGLGMTPVWLPKLS